MKRLREFEPRTAKRARSDPAMMMMLELHAAFLSTGMQRLILAHLDARALCAFMRVSTWTCALAAPMVREKRAEALVRFWTQLSRWSAETFPARRVRSSGSDNPETSVREPTPETSIREPTPETSIQKLTLPLFWQPHSSGFARSDLLPLWLAPGDAYVRDDGALQGPLLLLVRERVGGYNEPAPWAVVELDSGRLHACVMPRRGSLKRGTVDGHSLRVVGRPAWPQQQLVWRDGKSVLLRQDRGFVDPHCVAGPVTVELRSRCNVYGDADGVFDFVRDVAEPHLNPKNAGWKCKRPRASPLALKIAPDLFARNHDCSRHCCFSERTCDLYAHGRSALGRPR